MGHTAVARISGWTAAVPQLTVISFTVVSEDTRPEFGPSGSPYEALSHNFLKTLNGDDTAFLSAITFCSCSAGVDRVLVTWSPHLFLQPHRICNCLLLAPLGFIPHQYTVKNLLLAFFLHTHRGRTS